MNLFFTVITSISLLTFVTREAIAEKQSPRTPMQILQDSDRARGGIKEGLSWKSKITTEEDGDKTEREFLIKAKGNDAYVEALSPARTKGEIFIFNDRTMWFYKPSLKKPVSISPRQKLSGQAANGDIASTNYARDYIPIIEKTENLHGKKTHVLLLKAKSNNLTYDQIRYWINDEKGLAVKAQFLTLQGQIFKTALMEYGNSILVNGKKLPFVSRLTIVDAKFQNNKSMIEYEKPIIEDHAAALFNVNNLAR